MSTLHLKNYNNIIFKMPNKLIICNDDIIIYNNKKYYGWYISYNDYDINIYGNITTALVLGQMEKFYILNGDHRGGYEKLINYGFWECLKYYKSQINEYNKFTDKL